MRRFAIEPGTEQATSGRMTMVAATILSLTLCFSAVQAEPTYADKFAEYVAAGWPPHEIIAGLKRWFGIPFEIVIYNGEAYVQLVLRRDDFSVYRLETIGKLLQ